ncbi:MULTISPECIES: YcaO-like family protein [Actinomycetes]|uniref:YcaO-like family protein n=1 Tax=Actinomycetes TaxID=1760 RepID=UPI0010A8D283|nr:MULTISPECIES: YcaO-like family protein [Actinomycetes]
MEAADIITHYEAALRGMGTVVEFDISGLDRLGVPVTTCSALRDGRFDAQGNGYGRTLEAARIGGLGELAEGTVLARALREALPDAIRASRRELVLRDGDDHVVDPRTLGLPAGSTYDDETVLTWLPTVRLRTGESVLVPVDFLVSDSGVLDGEALIPPVTNGLGAGLDAERAIAHGLGEILQRHTNGLRFRALDRLSPTIDPSTLPASVRALADEMRRSGVTPVFKHAATEFGVCSTYVMGSDDHFHAGIEVSACGEAAHPSAEVSLTKALLEFANSRARKMFCFGPLDEARRLGPPSYWDAVDAGSSSRGEDRAYAAMREWADLSPEALRDLTAPRTDRTVDYRDIVVTDLPEISTQAHLLAHLLASLDGHTPPHDVLAMVTSHGDVTVAKVLVTNLEVEILSYGRIGELGVRASLDDDLDLVRLGAQPTGTHTARVRLTEDAEQRLGGAAWYSYEVAEQIVGDFYPLYREPPRHSVAV